MSEPTPDPIYADGAEIFYDGPNFQCDGVVDRTGENGELYLTLVDPAAPNPMVTSWPYVRPR